eukprot:XP_011682929.1 PREDICTED: probable serine/threonine-protein kinase samkC isoform X2 [Strongylocentrotus purpuratus]
MHGREARTPANITCSTPPPSSSGKTLLEYTTNLSERLRKAWEYTIQNTRQQQQQQKRQYDVKKRISKYDTGDFVWLHDPTNIRNKLEPNWKGPFRVSSSSDDGLNYDIVHVHDEKFKRRVHHNRLKPHRARAPQLMSTPPSPPTPQPTSIHGTERTTTQYPPGPPAEDETGRKVQSNQPTSHGPAYITWSSRPPDRILHHEQSNHDRPSRSSFSVRQQASNQPTSSTERILHHRQSDHDQPSRSSLSVRQQASNQPTSSTERILHHRQSDHDQPSRSSLSVRQQASNQPTNSSHQSRLIDSAPLQQQPRPSLPTTQTQHQLSSPVGQLQLRPQYQLRSTTHQSQLWPSSSAEQPKPSSSADQRQHQPSSSADQPQPQPSSSARSRSGRQVKVPAKFQDYEL